MADLNRSIPICICLLGELVFMHPEKIRAGVTDSNTRARFESIYTIGIMQTHNETCKATTGVFKRGLKIDGN